jgi:hypothetical protein
MDGNNLDPKFLTWKKNLKKPNRLNVSCNMLIQILIRNGSKIWKPQEASLLKWHFPWNFIRKWAKFLSIIFVFLNKFGKKCQKKVCMTKRLTVKQGLKTYFFSCCSVSFLNIIYFVSVTLLNRSIS